MTDYIFINALFNDHNRKLNNNKVNNLTYRAIITPKICLVISTL